MGCFGSKKTRDNVFVFVCVCEGVCVRIIYVRVCVCECLWV